MTVATPMVSIDDGTGEGDGAPWYAGQNKLWFRQHTSTGLLFIPIMRFKVPTADYNAWDAGTGTTSAYLDIHYYPHNTVYSSDMGYDVWMGPSRGGSSPLALSDSNDYTQHNADWDGVYTKVTGSVQPRDTAAKRTLGYASQSEDLSSALDAALANATYNGSDGYEITVMLLPGVGTYVDGDLGHISWLCGRLHATDSYRPRLHWEYADAAGGAEVTPTPPTGSGNVPTPVISFGSEVSPAPAAGTGDAPDPTVVGSVRTYANAEPASFTFLAADGGTALGHEVTPDPAAASGNVPTPLVGTTVDAEATPAPASGDGDAPTPAVSTGDGTEAGSTPAAGSGDVPTPVVSVSEAAIITPDVVQGQGSVPTPLVSTSGAANIQPTPAAGSGNVPTPAVATGAAAQPAPAAGSGNVPTPQVGTSGGVVVPVDPAEASGDVPAPAIVTTKNQDILPTPAAGQGNVPTPEVITYDSVEVMPAPAQGAGDAPSGLVSTTKNVEVMPAPAQGVGEAPGTFVSTATSKWWYVDAGGVHEVILVGWMDTGGDFVAGTYPDELEYVGLAP